MKKARKDLEKDKELARLYYLQGDTQKLVAEKVGVSRVTINKWVNDGAWDSMRTARTITRKELIAKMMKQADEKLEAGEMSYDEMSKLASSIEKMDKQTNIITIIEIMSAYNNWLVSRMQIDKELSPELVKTMNRYQDIFISEQLGGTKIEI